MSRGPVNATPDPLAILVLVGNPRANSRTSAAAHALALAVRAWSGVGGSASSIEVVEVAALAEDLLAAGRESIGDLMARVAAAGILVVASPTYKASYTGLLKLLFDRFEAGQLAGVPALPMMVAASPQHAMAADAHLRAVLIELGATCPTPAAFVLEADLPDIGLWSRLWAERHAWSLVALAEARGHGKHLPPPT